ncbi:MAG TPA: lysine--tRNA ligase [Actinomycetota bacterium]|nr:lysine--tRNA ligase [Actinomycetota bacterium]
MSDERHADVTAPGEAASEARGREAAVLAARRDSLERLRAAGMDPFALSLQSTLGTTEPTPTTAIRAEFGALEPDTVTSHRRTVAGRLIRKRDMGKLRFLVIRDEWGDLQLVCNDDTARAGLLDELDLGDIIGGTGRIGTTRRGELSLFVENWAMLTKSLRPLPEKWHGLQDPDLQQRRRYLHLITDETPRTYVLARAAVLKTIRRVLDAQGYTEIEGPMLQTVAGGAMARPFETFHHALGIPMKLRISLELYLKRMVIGGFERVYELGRNFRNEGIDRDHNPEFTMLEAYRAWVDYEAMMELSETLIVECARAVNAILGRVADGLAIPVRGQRVDLTPPFRRLRILDAVSEATGEQITLERDDLRAIASRHDVPLHEAWGPGKVVQELFEKLVEGTIVQPTFVLDFPREVSPLARPHRENPGLTEHFDLVAGGLELVTAFSELTDPIEQRAKFELQQSLKEAYGGEIHPLDEGFLRALEHGMPPLGGLGLGVDRLLLLLTDAPSLRDLIMFPAARPEGDAAPEDG